jgi:putative ABC transport system permease protein
MNVVSRGIRNAFRNYIRTISIVVIIGLAIGLSLSMLVARQAVSAKIASVNATVGNTITIAPAGYSGFSSVNNSLTTTELAKVSSISHVTNVSETLSDRLTTIGATSTPSFGGHSTSTTTNAQTSLTSPIKLNTTGTGGQATHLFINGGGSLPTNFSLPITIIGANTPTEVNDTNLTITSGKAISGTSSSDIAMVSASMASKNSLSVGSTFTAYGTTLTVDAIFSGSDTSTLGGDIIVPLATEQTLSGQSGDVTSAVATIDSLTNLNSATTAIKNALGSTADVTSSVAEADQTIAPLNNIKTITLYSLIGAVVAGSVIILLTMIMIVRERRREIGVLKAIGASNLKVMGQFMSEAVTLTLIGAVIGILIGVAAASPITKILVDNSTPSTTTTTQTIGRSGGEGGGTFGDGASSNGNFNFRSQSVHGAFGGVSNSLSNLHAVIGWSIILYGILAALVIALIGSTVASFFISKVRPAEVMRVE